MSESAGLLAVCWLISVLIKDNGKKSNQKENKKTVWYIKQRYCQKNLLTFKSCCMCSRIYGCTLKAALQLCCGVTVTVYRVSVCMNTLKHTSHVHRAAAASRSFMCNRGGFNCRWIRHAFIFFILFTEMLLLRHFEVKVLSVWQVHFSQRWNTQTDAQRNQANITLNRPQFVWRWALWQTCTRYCVFLTESNLIRR